MVHNLTDGMNARGAPWQESCLCNRSQLLGSGILAFGISIAYSSIAGIDKKEIQKKRTATDLYTTASRESDVIES